MRRSTLVATCAAALVLVLGVFFGARAVLVQSFERIEADTGRENAARLRNALEADIEQLAQATTDYGQWDATYQYALSKDPEFVRVNLTKDALDTLHVDLVWIVDSKGKTVTAFAGGRARRRGFVWKYHATFRKSAATAGDASSRHIEFPAFEPAVARDQSRGLADRHCSSEDSALGSERTRRRLARLRPVPE